MDNLHCIMFNATAHMHEAVMAAYELPPTEESVSSMRSRLRLVNETSDPGVMQQVLVALPAENLDELKPMVEEFRLELLNLNELIPTPDRNAPRDTAMDESNDVGMVGIEEESTEGVQDAGCLISPVSFGAASHGEEELQGAASVEGDQGAALFKEYTQGCQKAGRAAHALHTGRNNSQTSADTQHPAAAQQNDRTAHSSGRSAAREERDNGEDSDRSIGGHQHAQQQGQRVAAEGSGKEEIPGSPRWPKAQPKAESAGLSIRDSTSLGCVLHSLYEDT